MMRAGDIGSARIRCAPSLNTFGETCSWRHEQRRAALLFADALKTSNNMIAPCRVREDPPPLKAALVDLACTYRASE